MQDRPEDGGASEPPLGKLIPFMKNAAAKIFLDDPDGNQYIRVTADNRSVMLLCRSESLLLHSLCLPRPGLSPSTCSCFACTASHPSLVTAAVCASCSSFFAGDHF